MRKCDVLWWELKSKLQRSSLFNCARTLQDLPDQFKTSKRASKNSNVRRLQNISTYIQTDTGSLQNFYYPEARKDARARALDLAFCGEGNY